MTYTRTTWVDGSSPAVSAANLNNIEDGVSSALTLAKNVPSYAPSTAQNAYTPVLNAYNFKPATTRKTRAAITRAMNGGKMDILFIGGSHLTGIDNTNIKDANSTPRAMAQQLSRQLGVPQAGSGLVFPAIGSGTVASDLFTSTGTITYDSGNATLAAAATLTFAPPQIGTSAEVYYYDTASSSFTVSIDGGTATTVSTTGTLTIKKWSTTGLADIQHSVKVTSVSGTVVITAVAIQRASGIAVHNLSWDLSSTSLWANPGNLVTYRKNTFNASGITPDLYCVATGDTDFLQSNNGSAIWTSDMQNLMRYYTSSDRLIILPPGAWNSGPQITTIMGLEYGLADSEGTALIDWYDRIGGYSTGNTNGVFSADGNHLTAGAQIELGRQLAMIYANDAGSFTNVTSQARTATDIAQTFVAAPNQTADIQRTVDSSGAVLASQNSLGQYLEGGRRVTMITSRLTAAATSSSTTYASTGLQVNVDASKAYKFRCRGQYQSNTTTTGIGLRIGGTTTASGIRYETFIYGVAAANTTNQAIATLNATVTASSGVLVASTPYAFIVEGLIRTSAAGTLRLDFSSEVAGSIVTIHPDSHIEVMEIA